MEERESSPDEEANATRLETTTTEIAEYAAIAAVRLDGCPILTLNWCLDGSTTCYEVLVLLVLVTNVGNSTLVSGNHPTILYHPTILIQL
jgi:hypothetical protein